MTLTFSSSDGRQLSVRRNSVIQPGKNAELFDRLHNLGIDDDDDDEND